MIEGREDWEGRGMKSRGRSEWRQQELDDGFVHGPEDRNYTIGSSDGVFDLGENDGRDCKRCK